jgi:cytochrome c oxidase subunit 4
MSAIEATPRTYVTVWLTLMVLLALTISSAYVPLGWGNGALNLMITLTQASLVMLFSMHLRAAHPLLRVIAAIGFVGIVILIVLSLSDFMTR